MNEIPMRRLTYMAIALNACTAFLMSNYLLTDGWLSLTAVVGLITFAAYLQGHRFSTTGKELPRKTYLAALILYTGLLALPPMSRLKAAIFAYALARMLMFRAVWLQSRREAYLHLLLYFAVVATCFGHWRADWTLLPFLGLYITSLLLALVTLHMDAAPAAARPAFPMISLLSVLPATMTLALLLLLVTPLLPGPHIELIPDMPRISSMGDPGVAKKMEGMLNAMAHQKMRANSDKSLQQVMQQLLTQTAQVIKKAAELTVDLHLPPWWLLIIALLGYLLWKRRQRLWLSIQVKWLDPWQLARLDKKIIKPYHVPGTLHAAFERLWHYYGISRLPAQTPMEHIHAIRQEYQVLGKPSAQLVDFFQGWRYGQQSVAGYTEALNSYRQIRLVLSLLQRTSQKIK
jgi:hypothetical protein